MEGYINENKWVDLSKLPKFLRNGKECIDWAKSIGCIVPFNYNGALGNIKILKYYAKNNKIEVYIPGYTKGNYDVVYTSTLKQCQLNNILRSKIIDTNPDVLAYLLKQSDAYKYSNGSPTIIDVKCPLCGYIKKMSVYDLTHYGFSCDNCGDNGHYPNKFMAGLLDQLQCNYTLEASRTKCNLEWLERYRFDFLINMPNKKFFIEMDGAWHYNDKYFNSSGENSQRIIDRRKDYLAKSHGYDVIRINCNYKHIRERFNYIKDSILNSELYDLFNLQHKDINWEECNKRGITSRLYQACEYWNSGIHDRFKIANKMGISPATVFNYLKIGAEHGICLYNAENNRKHAIDKISQINKKRISKQLMVFTNDNIIGVFYSAAYLENVSMYLFGKQFKQNTITACCREDCKTAYGYNMKYISYEEYEQLLPQFQTIQNKCNLQEVI